jgi:hypothetical protein
MKSRVLGLFVLSLVLAACAPRSAATPFPTPMQGLPRWILYERGLSDILLGPPERTKPDLSQGHGLCEWEILGQKDNEVYVWALCTIYDRSIGTATDAPAVIRLGDDGSILEVEMPKEGFGNIRDLFPEDIINRMSGNGFRTGEVTTWGDHLDKRFADPSIPPLVVGQGVPLP